MIIRPLLSLILFASTRASVAGVERTISETRRRIMSLDQMLSAAASGDFAHYNPQHIIDAVNALLPLGKDAALAAIESYLDKRNLDIDPQEGLFLVLRVLFEVPTNPGYHLPMHLGGSSPPPPPALESLPHFPLVLIDDRPLMMISGFVLGGAAESITVHIHHFRATGTLRGKALAPSQSPSSVLDQFQAIYKRAYGTPPSQHEIALIQAQLSDRWSCSL
ncbi:hypothetical protein [Microcystis aeruginosa]|jgi:hypothetical protein|uniref:DUF1400 domain-containing protein n=1 Tax=Microcystis aeruginosa 11-30S32 TaxID=2358142 RepID=A0A510PDR1_MICAE|nr:hypothetical protein [Microcystis aeruginosa]GCA91905.1 hypothetical protein MAE30S32_05570 [Microcystis aeruginosa 11-30S32]